MPCLKCHCFLLFLILICLVLAPGKSAMASGIADVIRQECPKEVTKYAKILNSFHYRISDTYPRHGCAVLPVYYAMEKAPQAYLDFLDENAEAMSATIVLLQKSPEMIVDLRESPKLLSAIGAFVLDDDTAQKYSEMIQSFNKDNVSLWKHLSGLDHHYVALKMLVPNLPDLDHLKMRFSPDNAKLLIRILNATAVVSDEDFAPFLSELPNDTLETYLKFMNLWGARKLANILEKTPNALSALKPPMQYSEISDSIDAIKYSPSDFRKLQQEYMRFQKRLYERVNNEYGAAWADAVCCALEGTLAVDLYGASGQVVNNLQHFVDWLTSGTFFEKIILPSACEPFDNLQLLALNRQGKSLVSLADWFNTGRLESVLATWLPTTNAIRFKNAFSPKDNAGNTDDTNFWEAIYALADLRQNLDPSNRELLDWLLLELPKSGDPPWVVPAFIAEIGNDLFQIMRNGHFNNVHRVAQHLLDHGYPYSSDPSLFECYRRGKPEGCVDASVALRERGLLPEQELLKTGRTFKDKTGVDPEVAADVAWWVYDVGSMAATIAASVGTAGAAAPAAAANLGAIVARRGARAALKAGAKYLLKATGRRLAIKGGAKAYKAFMREAKVVLKKTGKVLTKSSALDVTYDTYELYSLLHPDIADQYAVPWEKALNICPQNQTKETKKLQESK